MWDLKGAITLPLYLSQTVGEGQIMSEPQPNPEFLDHGRKVLWAGYTKCQTEPEQGSAGELGEGCNPVQAQTQEVKKVESKADCNGR